MTDEILWSSLYIPTDDEAKVIAALQATHSAAEYKPYNPFPGGSGTPTGIAQRLRLFVAPPEDNWTRVIGLPDVELLNPLAAEMKSPVVYIWIGAEASAVEMVGGDALTEFLREGKSAENLDAAMNGPIVLAKNAPVAGEIAKLADEYGVDAGQADKMFQKAAKTVFSKLDKRTEGEAGSMQDAAKKSLDNPFSWGMPSAQRVAAIMACLNVPQNWREPAFSDLAAAYQIACLLDINEDAPLLPGDEDILDRVEFPLDYTPAYFAR
jgi:hypothetical protein